MRTVRPVAISLLVSFIFVTASSQLLAAATVDKRPLRWSEAQADVILGKTLTVRLPAELSKLSAGELKAVARLLEAGSILQDIYEESRHHQAIEAREALKAAHRKTPSSHTRKLIDLYDVFQGPIATTLENTREAILDVDQVSPGKNVYPPGIRKEEIESFLASHPQQRSSILDPRTVVRRAGGQAVKRDLDSLRRHPVLDVLHPGLKTKLEALSGKESKGLVAVPYAVAYADRLTRVYSILREAADAVEPDDPELARFLRNRAGDLLTNDYESGDASWVRGHFKRLNAQIGSYETYDDELYGVKTFFAMSLLVRDEVASESVKKAVSDLQSIENALPRENPKKVLSDIPVGFYDVIADFGQARGANTATILPNDSLFTRRYGRTILLRANIMRHPDLVTENSASYRAAVVSKHRGDFAAEGELNRTFWHEVGHYLGPDRDRRGRELDLALQSNADLLEEMKSDLVSLYAAGLLHARGVYDDRSLRAIYASGIRRVLQKVRPRRDQPYQTMQLMQMNDFLANGLLELDSTAGGLVIHYDRYAEVVKALLAKVMALQYEGDVQAADRFVEANTSWTTEVHEMIAAKMRAESASRFRLMRFEALGQ